MSSFAINCNKLSYEKFKGNPKVLVSKDLADRVANSNFIGLALEEVLRTSDSGDLNVSNATQTLRFQLNNKGQHQLFEVFTSRTRKNLRLNSVEIRDVASYKNATSQDVGELQCIDLDKLREERSAPKNNNSQPLFLVPEGFDIGNNHFHLDERECRPGLRGERGPDHTVDISLLKKCLSLTKSMDTLRLAQKNPKFAPAYCFNVQIDGGSRILEIVCVKKEPRSFVLMTTYFAKSYSVFGSQIGLKGLRLESYIDRLPVVIA